MSWRTDKRKTSERGYGWEWQKRRARHLQAQPLCVMCEAQGIVTAASVADHITPHRGDKVLFAGPLQSLCKRHHDSDKQQQERSGKAKPQIGADGWPVGGYEKVDSETYS